MGILRRNRSRGLPDGWDEILDRHVTVWRYLDDEERGLLAEKMDRLLRRRIWEAARGFELTDRMLVVVAAGASLIALRLDDDVYDGVSAIVLHPSTQRVERTTSGPVPGTESCGSMSLLGEAVFEGPVVISWAAASAAARHPEWGSDVVLHEFAHALDMIDGTIDGTPPLEPGALAEDWVSISTEAFDRLDLEGDEVIDDYGATDAGEFFAVVTETFFCVPDALADAHPDLYDLYRRYYRQDPRVRFAREPKRRWAKD